MTSKDKKMLKRSLMPIVGLLVYEGRGAAAHFFANVIDIQISLTVVTTEKVLRSKQHIKCENIPDSR